MSTSERLKTERQSAVLDDAHSADIRGALGTIRHSDIAPRREWWPRSRTLLAILRPGLIFMVGDNDAGAFGTHHPGRPGLRDQSPVDAALAGNRSLRQPGNGAAPRRGNRRRVVLLLWGTRMVRSGISRAFGTSLRR